MASYPAGTVNVSIRRTKGEITGFAWSPDGKRLACARAMESRDVVLVTGGGKP